MIFRYFSDTIKSIPGYEVMRCVLHAEGKLFPLAQEHASLSLRNEFRDFKEGNTGISSGDSQDIEEEYNDPANAGTDSNQTDAHEVDGSSHEE